MAVNYSNLVKQARLEAVITAIGSAGKLEILNSTGTVLATLNLASTAGSASNSLLTFAMPVSDTAADASGTASAARIRKGDNTDIITGLTVGVGTSFEVNLDSVSITAGQTVTINTATITHAV